MSLGNAAAPHTRSAVAALPGGLTTCASAAGDHPPARTNERFHSLASRNPPARAERRPSSACRLHARVRRQGPRDARLRDLSYRELRMALELTAVFRKVPEGYVAFVEELPGANTQGATLEEARANLREAVELTLQANRALAEEDLAGADVIREPLKLTA